MGDDEDNDNPMMMSLSSSPILGRRKKGGFSFFNPQIPINLKEEEGEEDSSISSFSLNQVFKDINFSESENEEADSPMRSSTSTTTLDESKSSSFKIEKKKKNSNIFGDMNFDDLDTNFEYKGFHRPHLDGQIIQSSVKKDTSSCGFSTGFGESVRVSPESLNTVKTLKNNVFNDNKLISKDEGGDNGLKKSEKSSNIFGDMTNDDLETNSEYKGFDRPHLGEQRIQSSIKKDPSSFGFSTGTGKRVGVSKVSLKAVKTLKNKVFNVNKLISKDEGGGNGLEKSEKSSNIFGDMNFDDLETNSEYKGFHRPHLDEELIQSSVEKNPPSFGFSTGSGKRVGVSKVSLNAVKTLKNNKFGNTNLDDSSFKQISLNKVANLEIASGFSTGSGKSVTVSKISLDAVKNSKINIFSDMNFDDLNSPAIAVHEHPPSSFENSHNSHRRFSTRTGKTVSISKSSLDKVKSNGNKLMGSNTSAQFKSPRPCSSSSFSSKTGFSSGSGKQLDNSSSCEKSKNIFSDMNFDDLYSIRDESDLNDMSQSDDLFLSEVYDDFNQALESNNQFKVPLNKPPKAKLDNKIDSRLNYTGGFPYPKVNTIESINFTKRSEARMKLKELGRKFSSSVEQDGILTVFRKNFRKSRIKLKSLELNPKADPYKKGLDPSLLRISPYNPEEFSFQGTNFFTDQEIIDGIFPLSENTFGVMNDNNEWGLTEIIDSFYAIPSINKDVVPLSSLNNSWIQNHYRWILWTTSSMDLRLNNANHACTPNGIIQRLKWRYDKEIRGGHRSVIRKIYEQDDTPAKPMILIVSHIFSNEDNEDLLELTDGWYSIYAQHNLHSVINKRKVIVGTKLFIVGAELISSEKACYPLEDNSTRSVRLKIHLNSTRRAHWASRLGLYHSWSKLGQKLVPKLKDLNKNGGNVCCIRVIVARKYPMLYMEKNEITGRTNYMNQRIYNEKVTRESNNREKNVEIILSQVRNDYEKNYAMKNKNLGPPKKMNTNQLKSLKSGLEIFEYVRRCSDPDNVLSSLSSYQMELFREYDNRNKEKMNREINDLVKQKLKDEGHSTHNFPKKCVPLLRLKIIDSTINDSESLTYGTLTVWRPSEELISEISENKCYEISNLSVSGYRNNEEEILLSSTKTTKFNCIEEYGGVFKRTERQLTPIFDLVMSDYSPNEISFKEIDTIGIILDIGQPMKSNFQVISICDLMRGFIYLKFWNSLTEFGMDKIIKVGNVLLFQNLQWRKSSSVGTIPSLFVTEQTLITSTSSDKFLASELNDTKNEVDQDFIEGSLVELKMLQKSTSTKTTPTTKKLNKMIHTPISRPSIGMTPIVNTFMNDPSLAPSPMEIVADSPASIQSERNKRKLAALEQISASPMYREHAPLSLVPLNCTSPKAPSRKRSRVLFQGTSQESQDFELLANQVMDEMENT